MLMKKCKIVMTILLTCLLLGNTFGSVAVKAAGVSGNQAEQTVETMAKADEYRLSGFPIMTMMPIVQSIKREMLPHLRSILLR